MEDEGSESDVSPEQLQEAVDTILGQFGYPDAMTVEHRSVDAGTKRTAFHLGAATDSGRTITIEHRREDGRSTVVEESAADGNQ
jgi:hypothetical protein